MAANTPSRIKQTTTEDRSGKTVEVVYQVECTALADGQDAAKAAVLALGIPAGYYFSNIHASNIGKNPLWFEVTISYTTTIDGSPVTAENPLDRPSTLVVSWDEWDEEYFEDADEQKIINYAGDPITPLPKRKTGRMVLTITKNFDNYDAVAYDADKYTTNTAAITIKGITYPAQSLLFLPPGGSEQYEVSGGTTYHYYQVTFRLAADENLHKDKIENRGLWQINTEGDYVPILDDASQPITAPRALYEDGAACDPGDPAEVIVARPYPDAAWGIDFN